MGIKINARFAANARPCAPSMPLSSGYFASASLSRRLDLARRPPVSINRTTESARKPTRLISVWGVPCATWSAPTMPSRRPVRMKPTNCVFTATGADSPAAEAGRRNVQDGVLDQIKFIRISMLTDPALDAGRHEFEMRTLLGRVLSPEDNLKFMQTNGWIPPVREIYPLVIGSMSFGALSPSMWEGLQMGIAYLNEELGMPVRICTGEGGCPPRLLRSQIFKIRYFADRQRIFRLGRNYSCPARDEGRSLCHRNQIRTGRQAR